MFRTIVAISVLLTTAACSTKYTPQTVEVVDPGPPQRVLPTIRVLDDGLTPRRPYRYRVPPGQEETLYVELVRAQAMMAEGKGSQAAMPPFQLEVKMGPSSGTPEGFIRHPVAITQIRLSKAADQMSPAQRQQVERSLAPLLNVKGYSEMDVQGRIRRGDFQGLENVPPDLNVMLGNIRSALLTVPFPDQPLGIRARWEVERKVQLSGFWVDQVVTYTILAIRKDEVDLQISARQSAEPQQIDIGRLDAYQSSVIGSATVRLTHFTAYSEAESTTQMRVTQPAPMGDSRLVRVESRTAVNLYPAQDGGDFNEPPEEKPADPADANVVTDPGKQKLKWYTP
jgi:hypothetical protein